MMKKKDNHTNITPLPSFIPRQLAVDILHSHSEIITLNPLVLSHKPISAPREAPADEYYSTWYEIVERIQVVPGTGRLGGSKISFKACFHDIPMGVQTHVYAPMGIDLRHNYRIAGTQPGEPAEYRELGLNAPATGLYLREDIEIRANFAMVGFVKGQLKAATKILVDRLIKKAELLDAGVLQGMMENGRLKTFNPADRSSELGLQQDECHTPVTPTFSMPPSSPSLRYQVASRPGTSSSSGQPPGDHQQGMPTKRASVADGFPSSFYANELPGDTSYYHQVPAHLTTPNHNTARDSIQSTASHPSTGGLSYASSITSQSTTSNNYPLYNNQNNNPSRPVSTASAAAPFGLADNGHNKAKQQFAVELPAMEEMHETQEDRV